MFLQLKKVLNKKNPKFSVKFNFYDDNKIHFNSSLIGEMAFNRNIIYLYVPYKLYD